ncbi:hypothetical protein HWV62_43088, partial [Athelia sp. TMB]
MTSYEHPYSSRYDYNALPYDPDDLDPGKLNDIQSPVLPGNAPTQEPSFPLAAFILQCVLPPFLGLSYVAFGIYLVCASNPLVISHDTKHTTIVSTVFIALSSIWHFLALIPILGLIDSVKSEEWWRRLLRCAPFARVNSVSSNFGGAVGFAGEMLLFSSSPYFKIAWVTAILAVITGDIAPGAINVVVGFDPANASYKVPALPPNSIYSNFAQPFRITNDFVHASVDVAPIYYNALAFGLSFVTARPSTLNALIPRPTVIAGQGYRYSTDVAFMKYDCQWYAPDLAEPDTMADLQAQNLSITVGGIQGVGYSPFIGNGIYFLNQYRNASSGQPSFDGHVAFIISSGTPLPMYGFLNISSVPSYTLSPAWVAAAAEYKAANPTGVFNPPQSLSAVVCTPYYTLEPWSVEIVNGTATLLKKGKTAVGNLDPTQLQIAVQDAFNMMAASPPVFALYGTSFALLNLLFEFSGVDLEFGVPKSGSSISLIMNIMGLPASLQAYLDGSPFGSFEPADAKLLTPALVLSGQLDFLCIAGALY